MSDSTHRLLAGALGGSAGTFVGHPFDTLKVHVQTTNTAIVPALKTYMRKPIALYRGASTPVVSRFFLTGANFLLHGNMAASIQEKRTGERPASGRSDAVSSFSAGVLSGLILSTLRTPTEFVKVQAQTNAKATLRSLLTRCGPLGLYQGYRAATVWLCAETGVYFGSYSVYSKWLAGSGERSILPVLISGALAGMTASFASYPLDGVRTIQQAQTPGKQVVCQSMLKELRTMSRRRTLYTGLTPALLRMMPAAAVQFYVFEKTMQYLSRS